VVPVKPLRRGKSRLADVLSVQERTQLNRYLFTHTLEVLQHVPEIERTLVVSRDSAALALARDYGAHTLQEQGNSQLNLALKRATMLLRSSAVATILVLPADLPLLTVADVRALLEKRALAPYFQFVLTSAACGYRKPHPCLFKRALDAFRILPEEAAMIGDTLEADILGANRLGIFSIWITRRADTRAGIPPDSTPDAVIASLSDLPPLLDSLAASPS
jgi:HAD superfamily hydrolase (TIGR01509 family)